MTSQIITIAAPDHTLSLVPVSEKRSLEAQVRDLCQKMRDARIPVDEWEDHFFNHYSDIESEEGREQTSLALCFLLYHMIPPKQYLEFLNPLLAILEITLPSGEDIETFIEEYENDLDEIILTQKKLKVIDEVFSKELEDLTNKANRANQELTDQFEALKETLNSFVGNRKSMSKKACDQIESLSSKIEGLFKKLDHHQVEVEQISHHLKKENDEYLYLLAECQTLLKMNWY